MIYEFYCEICGLKFSLFTDTVIPFGGIGSCPICVKPAKRIPSLPYLPKDIKKCRDYADKNLDADADMRQAYAELERRGQLNEVDDRIEQNEVRNL